MPGRSLFFEEGIITCFFVCVKRERGGGGGGADRRAKAAINVSTKQKIFEIFIYIQVFLLKKKIFSIIIE